MGIDTKAFYALMLLLLFIAAAVAFVIAVAILLHAIGIYFVEWIKGKYRGFNKSNVVVRCFISHHYHHQ